MAGLTLPGRALGRRNLRSPFGRPIAISRPRPCSVAKRTSGSTKKPGTLPLVSSQTYAGNKHARLIWRTIGARADDLLASGAEREPTIDDGADVFLEAGLGIIRPDRLDVLESLAFSEAIDRVHVAARLERDAPQPWPWMTPRQQ